MKRHTPSPAKRHRTGLALAFLFLAGSTGTAGHAEWAPATQPDSNQAEALSLQPANPMLVPAPGYVTPTFLPSPEVLAEELLPEPAAESPTEEAVGSGVASWYGPRFAGRQTANGETFDPSEMTAAHRSLPFGSKVRVTNVRSGRSVIVRINDRGPFTKKRVIDLSQAAAGKLGIIGPGKGEVTLALLTS